MTTTTLRTRLNAVLKDIGYFDVVEGKSDHEVIAMIEKEFVALDDIDENQPFELTKYDIYDIFWAKHWIHLPTLIAEDKLERLYHLLCDFKRERQK